MWREDSDWGKGKRGRGRRLRDEVLGELRVLLEHGHVVVELSDPGGNMGRDSEGRLSAIGSSGGDAADGTWRREGQRRG